MPMTPLPTPPSITDPVNFAARADAFCAALLLFQTEANGLSQSAITLSGGTMTAPLGFSVGSAAAPGLFRAGTAGTGIWSPGIYEIAISAGGVEGLRCGNYGFGFGFGIGGTPTVPFELIGSVNGPWIASIRNNASFGLNTSVLRLDSNGGGAYAYFKLCSTFFTPTGIYKTAGAYLEADGAGGLNFNTLANQPIAFNINSTLALQIDTARMLKFEAASVIANAAIATVLGSVGPTGSHTTVQEWLQVKNTAGTVRYIPMF